MHRKPFELRSIVFVWAVVVLGVVGALSAMVAVRRRGSRPVPVPVPEVATVSRVRAMPEAFPSNTHLPDRREGTVSGSIDMETFSPGRDLTYVDDARVWWESDNDKGDDEDDHSMHRSVEAPLRRLIELVVGEGGTLKVQDAYRPTGIHASRSLHREGRAVDVTCDELGLERLAGLCWVAGFDWVYYEAKGRGGAHVHCSVRREPVGD